jgi:hypothetical protein
VESGVNQSNDEVLRSRVGGNVEKPTQELVEPVAPLYIIWYLGGPTEGVCNTIWVSGRGLAFGSARNVPACMDDTRPWVGAVVFVGNPILVSVCRHWNGIPWCCLVCLGE